MAYDDDFRSRPRSRDDGRWAGERHRDERGGRGFFERAGDEVASWFGDEDAERRREQDERSGRYDRPEERAGSDRGRFGAASYGRHDGDRYQRDPGEQRNFGGSGSRDHSGDPHYSEWRQRQIDALDRDYDEYRREHQSKFENEFSGWRTQRQSKREVLASLRDGTEVVGSDDQRIGSVDKVKGDRVILRKNDSEAGGVHRSFSCALIDRFEGDRLILTKSAEEARGQLQREDRDDGAFRPRDRNRDEPVRGEAARDDGPHVLERSFSGTYR